MNDSQNLFEQGVFLGNFKAKVRLLFKVTQKEPSRINNYYYAMSYVWCLCMCVCACVRGLMVQWFVPLIFIT